MSLVQQLRSIVSHGLRLAFFLMARRNAFNVSCAASAIVLALTGSVLAGLHLSIAGANEESGRLDALLELFSPGLIAVSIAGVGRALSRRLPFHLLLAAVAGTMPASETGGMLANLMDRYVKVSVVKTPWPEGIAPMFFGYAALAIIAALLIA
jgi:hypothetical protein